MPGQSAWTVLLGMALVLCYPCQGAQADESSSARINYILHCQGCHLADGSGTPGKVPALKDHAGRFLQVPGGREYLVQVPGTSQSALSDAEVAAVLNWILQNFSKSELPEDFAPYTEKEISRSRQHPLADVKEIRSELLAKIVASQDAAPGRTGH
jgi:cytochrome c551/c552